MSLLPEKLTNDPQEFSFRQLAMTRMRQTEDGNFPQKKSQVQVDHLENLLKKARRSRGGARYRNNTEAFVKVVQHQAPLG